MTDDEVHEVAQAITPVVRQMVVDQVGQALEAVSEELHSAIDSEQSKVEGWVSGLVNRVDNVEQRLAEVALPNVLGVVATDAWQRFILGEAQRIRRAAEQQAEQGTEGS